MWWGPNLLPKASKIMCATHREVKQTYPSLGQRKVYCWAESEQSSGGGFRPTDIVDELLLKTIDAPTKKGKIRDEAR